MIWSMSMYTIRINQKWYVSCCYLIHVAWLDYMTRFIFGPIRMADIDLIMLSKPLNACTVSGRPPQSSLYQPRES